MKTPFQLRTFARLCAVSTLTLAALGSAVGAPVTLTAASDVTRGAVAVTTTMGSFLGDVSHLIDQTGLSSPYVSGVTAFDAYMSSATHNSGLVSNSWRSNFVKTGFLSFDLGAAYNMDGLAWFGLTPGGSASVSGIKVYADDDSDATNGNAGLLFDSGTFGSAVGSTSIVKPNLFSFSSAANTRYLTIEIVSNDGSTVSGLGEVVFRQSLAPQVAAVPEPQSFALAGLGLLALGVTRRRVTKR